MLSTYTAAPGTGSAARLARLANLIGVTPPPSSYCLPAAEWWESESQSAPTTRHSRSAAADYSVAASFCRPNSLTYFRALNAASVSSRTTIAPLMR